MEEIVNEIVGYMNKILSHPTYMGIFNEKGQAIYIDDTLQEHYQFISSFINENFKLLNIGDHSIPLSGLNLAFYKISDHAMIILHTKEGPVGQLLAFKSRMFQYSDKIDALSAKFTEDLVKKIPKPRVKKISKTASAERIPVLTVDINKKKFAMDEAAVLHIIDGKKTITEICEEIKIPRLKVNEILKKYQKKGWLKLKRVIGKKGEDKKAPIIKVPKKSAKLEKPISPRPRKITPKPTKIAPAKPESKTIPFIAGNESAATLSPTSSPNTANIPQFSAPSLEVDLTPEEDGIYIFPIATQENPKVKISKNDQKILKLCDGRNTVEDICQIFSITKVDLMADLHKLVSKGLIRLTQIIPEDIKETTTTLIQKEPQTESKIASEDEKNTEIVNKLDELLEKVEHNISEKKKQVITEVPTPEIPNEEVWVEDEEFEETLSDLDDLLKSTDIENEVTEEQSFNAAINELTGLLDKAELSEESMNPVGMDSSIVEPVPNSVSNTIPVPPKREDVQEISASQIFCPHCSAPLPSTKRICPKCGNPIRTCPHCSAPISVHTRICPECNGLVSK
ncbi:MAG: double zinc ribbon domain-containing protein [Candidatus Helarchaeota archaeon]